MIRQKHPIFEKLNRKTTLFLWRPEEVDLFNRSQRLSRLEEHDNTFFLSNFKNIQNFAGQCTSVHQTLH